MEIMKCPIKTVAINLFLLFNFSAFCQQMSDGLKFLEPLTGKSWVADSKAPDGRSSTKVNRRYYSLWNGVAVGFEAANAELKYFEEGYFYLDDETNKVMFFSVSSRGGAMKGEVSEEDGKIAINGKTTIRNKTFDYKNTIEFFSDDKMIDRWFQNASGSWKPGHIIEFRKTD
jgi:hypothetical protein